ncbi:uncharacterized protein PAF06_016311 [Gastrophryne carolinensis]
MLATVTGTTVLTVLCFLNVPPAWQFFTKKYEDGTSSQLYVRMQVSVTGVISNNGEDGMEWKAIDGSSEGGENQVIADSNDENAWSRGAPSFSPGLHYTGQAFKRRNVVRFKNKGAKEDLPDRRHVIRELLCHQMGFTPADILAVINLPDRQGYDISFKLMASLDRFWASVTKFRGAEGWDQFILIPVSKPGTVSVNILFWNESVPPQDIVIWLRRHCDMVSDLTKCLDDDGIWTGGWRVLVKLRQHSNVTLHLPNSFFIGRERGVCFYAGQPRLCFKCGKAGHVAGVCTVVKCNLCGEIGHTSAMCTNVRCNLCEETRSHVIVFRPICPFSESCFRHYSMEIRCPFVMESFSRCIKKDKVEKLNKIDKVQIYGGFASRWSGFVCAVSIENQVLFTKPATV